MGLLGSSAFFLVLSVIALYNHIKHEGFSFSTPQMSLWFNMVACVFLILNLVDPFSIRDLVSPVYYNVVGGLLFPAVCSGTLMLSFFLNEMLIANKLMKPQLDKFKWPFVLVVVAILVLYLYIAVQNARYITSLDVLRGSTIFTTVFCFLELVYFIIVGVVTIVRLNKFSSNILRRLIPLVISVCVASVLFVAGLIIFTQLTYQDEWKSRQFEAAYILIWLGTIILVGSQIVFFRVPTSMRSAAKIESTNSTTKKLQELSNSNI